MAKPKFYSTTNELNLSNYPDLTPTARLITVWVYAYSLKHKALPMKAQIQESIGAGERTFTRAWKQLLAENLIKRHQTKTLVP